MKYGIIILLVISTIATTSAQHHGGKRAQRLSAVTELRSDLRAWFERDVYPSLKQWHSEYDAALTAEDRASLQQLRVQAKQLKEQVTTELKALRESASNADRKEMHDRLRGIREKHRSELEQLIQRVKPIAKRSRTTLRGIFDTHEDQIDAWREKARDIVGDWRDEHEDLGLGEGMGKHGGLPLIGGDGRKAALRFILWDGTMPPAPQARLQQNVQRPITVAPAPSGNAATITADNVPSGQHTFTLVDMNGTIVRTQSVSAINGSVSQRMDLSGLPAGTYVVRIETPEGVRSANVIVHQ